MNGPEKRELINNKIKSSTFRAAVETQGCCIKRLRCDNGSGEYANSKSLEILVESGINYGPSPPHSQDKNDVVERMIRTFNTKARALLLELPTKFCAEAIRMECDPHWIAPTASLDHKSP